MNDTDLSPEQNETPTFAPASRQRLTIGKRLRRLMFGNPLSSEHMEHTLLSKLIALPVFASDAISSVAYATQEIILVLGAAGLYAAHLQSAYSHYTLLLASLIVGLLIIVVFSYWQTIFGYPSGGGSYIVSKDNLGTMPGLIAAAALLIDYVLTVSVSVAAGVQNLAHIPLVQRYNLDNHLVLFCVLFIAILTLANLRGLKESGALFAIPTYTFVGLCYLMIFLGFFGRYIGFQPHMNYIQTWGGAEKAAESFGIFVLLKAFASGCSAMTGTEAVSDGIPAFKEPKARNAALTLVMMGCILGTIFIGITALAMRFHIVYWAGGTTEARPVIDQLSSVIFGQRLDKDGMLAVGYYITQFFTAAILILAANTSFADFPRLASILARDRFLPKQLSNLGDKLVFANGVMLLGLFASLLIIIKNGNVDALIPLYAVGVFTAFTLSQTGMVFRWLKMKQKGWQVKAMINGIGAVTTGLVLLTIAFEKFLEGAYIVIFLVIALVLMFRKIYDHYADVAQQLKMADYQDTGVPLTNTVLIMVASLHRGLMPAIKYGRTLSPDVRAVHIETDPARTPQLKDRWEKWVPDVPLVILNSPYRSFITPIMHYLDAVQVERRNHLVTVVVPEFVSTKWWHNLLHGNTGLRLKLALLARRDVIVANVRYFLHDIHGTPSDAFAEEQGFFTAPSGGHPIPPPTSVLGQDLPDPTAVADGTTPATLPPTASNGKTPLS